jgi:hypothetical protein
MYFAFDISTECPVRRGDTEIVTAAVMEWGESLMWAAETLRTDRNFVMQLVRLDGNALGGASETLQADAEVCL